MRTSLPRFAHRLARPRQNSCVILWFQLSASRGNTVGDLAGHAVHQPGRRTDVFPILNAESAAKVPFISVARGNKLQRRVCQRGQLVHPLCLQTPIKHASSMSSI